MVFTVAQWRKGKFVEGGAIFSGELVSTFAELAERTHHVLMKRPCVSETTAHWKT